MQRGLHHLREITGQLEIVTHFSIKLAATFVREFQDIFHVTYHRCSSLQQDESMLHSRIDTLVCHT